MIYVFQDYVRDKIAEYINDMISIGVKGFRVDAAKHMWPGDIEAILVNFKTNTVIWNAIHSG